MKLHKKYIPVVVVIDEEGKFKPIGIVWENKHFKIEKIKSCRNAYSKVGGAGVLYEVIIEGKLKRIFYERDKFFIESSQP